ncbi:MAG: hypothetical protein ABI977_20680 [Acidobacteriota bacterium]
MLANLQDTTPQSGFLSSDVHLPATSRYELIEFITNELPRWRDRSDRKTETAETSLTSQLCAHLNSMARHSEWDFLQFRVEETDEQHKSRKIDLVAAPCGVAVLIEGRQHTDFEPILPIECKRLPTPKGKDRDEREYVINRHASTGGIQRFKAGHHGEKYTLAVMIAYVQKESPEYWSKCIAEWIKGLVDSGQSGWTAQDFLHHEKDNKARGIAVFRSSHARDNGLREIELRHLWLKMN